MAPYHDPPDPPADDDDDDEMQEGWDRLSEISAYEDWDDGPEPYEPNPYDGTFSEE